MRKLIGSLSVALVMASVFTAAQSGQSVPRSDNERGEAWFVELASAPAIEGTSAAALDNEESAFHRAAAAAGARYTRGRRFRTVWNGVTIRASARDIAAVRQMPEVRAVYPVANITLDQVETPPG